MIKAIRKPLLKRSLSLKLFAICCLAQAEQKDKDLMPKNPRDIYLNNTRTKGEQLKKAASFENEYRSDFGENENDNFLNAIQGIESSFGTDTEHPVVDKGIHKGDAAIGRFGLMPNTVRDIANKLKNREQTQLGQSIPQKATFPRVEALSNAPESAIREELSRDEALERLIARLLAKDVLERQQGNEDKAAYSWTMGHNRNPANIADEDLKNSNYVNKFKQIKKTITKK